MDLVSIIIPTYNTLSNYLTDCLDSCLNQTYSNLEILVVDDNSDDPTTLRLLQEYSRQDPRVHVIYQHENHGQAYGRNLAIDQCHGKYFTMIDHDDLLCPDFIERCVAALQETPADFAMSHIVTFKDDPNEPLETMLIQHRQRFGEPIPSNTMHDKWNLFGRDHCVISLNYLTTMGRLFYLPAAVYGKLFVTENYKASGVRLDPSAEMRNVEDEDWLMKVGLKLKNFVLLDFYGVKHRLSITAASTGSARYCQQSINAAVRRYEILCNAGVGSLYYTAILKHALESAVSIFHYTTKQADRNEQFAIMQPKFAKLFYPLCPHQGGFDAQFSFNLKQIYKCLYPKAPQALFVSKTNIACNLALKQRLEVFAYQGLDLNVISLSYAIVPMKVTALDQVYQMLLKDQNKEQRAQIVKYPLNSFNDNGVSYHLIKDSKFIQSGLCTPSIEPQQEQGLVNLIKAIHEKNPVKLIMVEQGDEWSLDKVKQANLDIPVIELTATSKLQDLLRSYPEFALDLNFSEPPKVTVQELSKAQKEYEGPTKIEQLPH